MINDTDTDTDDSEIDNEWVDEFKKKEEIYDDFYKEKVEHIKLFYLYINPSNVLETIKKDFIVLDENSILKKEKIILLIKNNQVYNSIKYKLLSLIRFNIDIEPEDINKFINTTENEFSNTSFITSEKYLNDIKYSNTISMFQDLNSLYFIFYESNKKTEHSAPIVNNNNNNNNNNNKKTRRVTVTMYNKKI